MNNSVITTTVLEQLTHGNISERHLHHTFPALVQTLQVGYNIHHSLFLLKASCG